MATLTIDRLRLPADKVEQLRLAAKIPRRAAAAGTETGKADLTTRAPTPPFRAPASPATAQEVGLLRQQAEAKAARRERRQVELAAEAGRRWPAVFGMIVRPLAIGIRDELFAVLEPAGFSRAEISAFLKWW